MLICPRTGFRKILSAYIPPLPIRRTLLTCAACRNMRRHHGTEGPPYALSATSGWPRCCMCARTWWPRQLLFGTICQYTSRKLLLGCIGADFAIEHSFESAWQDLSYWHSFCNSPILKIQQAFIIQLVSDVQHGFSSSKEASKFESVISHNVQNNFHSEALVNMARHFTISRRPIRNTYKISERPLIATVSASWRKCNLYEILLILGNCQDLSSPDYLHSSPGHPYLLPNFIKAVRFRLNC